MAGWAALLYRFFFQGNYILGTPNTDDFRATAGKDFIIDHSGQNNIRGEQGNDLIVASGGVIHGDENNDIISVISQNSGNDVIVNGDN